MGFCLARADRSGGEKTWSIEDVHNFGLDHDRTPMARHANISAQDEIHYDEHFRRTWEYYLLGSAAGFRVRALAFPGRLHQSETASSRVLRDPLKSPRRRSNGTKRCRWPSGIHDVCIQHIGH